MTKTRMKTQSGATSTPRRRLATFSVVKSLRRSSSGTSLKSRELDGEALEEKLGMMKMNSTP